MAAIAAVEQAASEAPDSVSREQAFLEETKRQLELGSGLIEPEAIENILFEPSSVAVPTPVTITRDALPSPELIEAQEILGTAQKENLFSILDLTLQKADADLETANEWYSYADQYPEAAEIALDEAQKQVKQRFDDVENLKERVLARDIDPNRLFHNKSAAARFGAALSVAVGQMVSTRTGAPNTALKIIESAIERDIRAQEIDSQNLRFATSTSLSLLDRARGVLQDKKAAIAFVKELRWQEAQAKFMANEALFQGPLQRAQFEQALLEMQAKELEAQEERERQGLRVSIKTTIGQTKQATQQAELARRLELAGRTEPLSISRATVAGQPRAEGIGAGIISKPSKALQGASATTSKDLTNIKLYNPATARRWTLGDTLPLSDGRAGLSPESRLIIDKNTRPQDLQDIKDRRAKATADDRALKELATRLVSLGQKIVKLKEIGSATRTKFINDIEEAKIVTETKSLITPIVAAYKALSGDVGNIAVQETNRMMEGSGIPGTLDSINELVKFITIPSLAGLDRDEAYFQVSSQLNVAANGIIRTLDIRRKDLGLVPGTYSESAPTTTGREEFQFELSRKPTR
jgi:hypothetical protein